jgi:pilus assembly protein CpaB
MRAISIRTNDVNSVAGFVTPGTRVDVVVIIAPAQGAQERISRLVLSNVQVLTAGTRIDQDEARKDGKPIRSTVVTLMLSPFDAERLALAQAEGELMLTLRNPLDVEPTVSPGVRRAGLFDGMPSAPAPTTPRSTIRRVAAPVVVPAPPVVVPIRFTVETIKAGKSNEVTLDVK